MKLLAIETSSDICSVAYIVDGKYKNIIEEKFPRQHAEKLPVFYNKLVDQSNFRLIDIDAIAISIGPGSFTGLRIGLSYAKGLAYSHGLPLIPVPSMQSLLYGSGKDDSNIIILTHSHSDKYFIQKSIGEIEVLIGNNINEFDIDLSNTKIIHYSCDHLFSDIEDKQNIISINPSAKWIGELAHQNYNKWIEKEPFKIVPEYISPFKIGG